MFSSERRHCETLLTNITQRTPAYENDSLRYVMTGAGSEQPVGAPFHQWVGCFPHSGSWQAQGGLVYICRDQRKHVFHNMGPLISLKLESLPFLISWIIYYNNIVYF